MADRETCTIITHHGMRVKVQTDHGTISLKPPRGESWVVGDRICLENGRPAGREERKSCLSRIGSDGRSKPIAANVDLAMVVTAAGVAYKPHLLDRFVVSARHGLIEPFLVLNKTDLDQDEKYKNKIAGYENLGITICSISAVTGEGFERLEELLTGKTSIVVGQSGVGKTSIINRIFPGVNLPVGEINAKTEKGRHTTTATLMLKTKSGITLIDSPGIRHFSPSGLEAKDVARYFPGFDRFFGNGCKYRNCLHMSEPECAILSAVKDGRLSVKVHESYKRLVESIGDSRNSHYE